MSVKKHRLLLGLIIAIAAIVRFWHLGSNPPALSWDEAAWGYNAFTISRTGADEFGRFLPLDYLESFGDFKPPVYAYLTVLPVAIFGLTEFATRFASAFFGTLTVLFTYLLAKELFSPAGQKPSFMIHNSLFIPLLSAFLLAISPWHIMLSRAAFEANVATFFLVAGITFFLIGLRRKGCWLISALSFALSLMTFNTARVVGPLLVLVLAIAFRRQLWQRKAETMLALVLAFALLLPTFKFLSTPMSRLRFHEVNIFSDTAVVLRANQAVANDNNAWWSTVIHNRRWGYALEFIRHYFDNLNPRFLFVSGDGNPKFSTQDVGSFYLWEAPFLVWGLLVLVRNRRPLWWLVPLWLVIGILPAATAKETPHALRIETTLPTWQIMTALGLVGFFKKANKMAVYLLAAVIVFYFALFQHGLWRHYPLEYASEWQHGNKEAIAYISGVTPDYDQIWFSDYLGRPYIYFLYYLQTDPQAFRSSARIYRESYGFVHVDSFAKYHFYRAKEQPKGEGKALYVNAAENIPPQAEIIAEFPLPDGKANLVAYEI